MRFVLSIYHAIRAQVGKDFPIGIKLNSADFMKGGFSEEDSMQVVQSLADAGINLIEISGGTYESPSMMGSKAKASTIKREAYFLDYMEKVRQLVDTPLVVTGGFRSAPAMSQALASAATDFIGLARTTAVDAEFPNKLLNDKHYSMKLVNPTTGNKAMDHLGMLSITWYEQQLWRIAKGKEPKPNLNAWMVVFKTVASAGIHAFKKRRA